MAGLSVTKVKLGRPTYSNGSIRLLVDFFFPMIRFLRYLFPKDRAVLDLRLGFLKFDRIQKNYVPKWKTTAGSLTLAKRRLCW